MRERDRKFARFDAPQASLNTPNQLWNMASNGKTLTNTITNSNTNAVPHKVNFINVTDMRFNHLAYFEDIAVETAIVPSMIELMDP